MNVSGIPVRAPAVLRTVAVLGVVVAIVGTIVTWSFLGDLEETTNRSLLIGEQATMSLDDTIDIADQVLAAVDDGLITVQSTLATLDGVLQASAGLAGATGSLSSSLPASFDNIDAALATVEGLGETVDSTLSAFNDLPFGPDYDPAVPFPRAIGNLRQALDPIADDLATISTELQNFADGSGALTTDIDALVNDVETTRQALAGTDDLLDEYRDAAGAAALLAIETRDQLASSMTRMRLVLLALGMLLMLSQYVPWTLARLLEASRPVQQPIADRSRE